MANEVTTTNGNKNPAVALIKDTNIQKMIHERLGKRAGQFTTSLLSVVNASPAIAECVPMTIIQAALTAASMDLPINQNLGFAYIVPYNNRAKGVKEAQFQMGWKGFVQLAQRSGTFRTINATEVREGELKSQDRMTGELKFEWYEDEVRNDHSVIGYLAFFELLNGFRKSHYMTKKEIEEHATRYSQAYRSKGKGFKTPWETDFDLMAQKTVLKLCLSKYAPLSTEMQEAIASDQSVDDGNGKRFFDNEPDVKASDEQKRAIIDANVDTDESQQSEETVDPENVDVEQELNKAEENIEKAKKRFQKK